jgi:hypothetical protein
MQHALDMKNASNILVKHECKRPLGRFTRRCGDNIKAKYNKIGYVDVNWVHIAQAGFGRVQL